MSVEEQARLCREGLEATLRTLHEWTERAETANVRLLHSMNDVLRAAVTSNFGAACPDAIDSLKELICREQYGMLDRVDDLTLLYFARSFSVVLKNAVDKVQKNKAGQLGEEEQARLGATLRSVHEWTERAETGDGRLLHRMNAVLRAAVASDFGAACREAIDSLYESIYREKYGMLDRVEDLSLLYFARSFVVVLKEAVRQLEELWKNTVSVPRIAPLANGENIMILSKKEEGANNEAADWAVSVLDKTELGGGTVRVKRATYKIMFPGDGKITILDVPECARGEDIRKLLSPFGPIIDFRYPLARNGGCGHALVNLQSNEAADKAVACLFRRKLGGCTLRVKRGWSALGQKATRGGKEVRVRVRASPQLDGWPSQSAKRSVMPESSMDSDEGSVEHSDNCSPNSSFSVD